MNFTKMHGLGNDFIVQYSEMGLPEGAPQLAVALCDRHFGVGGDGMVYILPSRRADFQMRIFNSDGTEAEQCGNAIRCVAKYVYDIGLIGRRSISVETIGAGVQEVHVQTDGQNKVDTVRVDMGEPVLEGRRVPTLAEGNPVMGHPIEVDGRTFRFTAVSMGNPHCIIFVENAANVDLRTWGPRLETHPLFPKKTNVEFVTVNTRNHADMRVWERGAGPTLACGTGACATLVASVLGGHMDRRGTVSLKGGDLLIEWDEATNRVYMTGPAREVFKGSF